MTTEQLDIEELVERVRTYALDITEGRAEADWHGDWYIEFAQAFLHVTAALERAERHRAAASQDAVYFRKRMVKAEAVVEAARNLRSGDDDTHNALEAALSTYDEPPTA